MPWSLSDINASKIRFDDLRLTRYVFPVMNCGLNNLLSLNALLLSSVAVGF